MRDELGGMRDELGGYFLDKKQKVCFNQKPVYLCG